MVLVVRLIHLDRGLASVSCSPSASPTAGTGLGFWLTGKLGRAWDCMGGAWVAGGGDVVCGVL